MAKQQPHRLVKRVESRFGVIEIRFYPPANRASVDVKNSGGSYDALQNAGFRELAGYIFGGNERKESIAMTTPVVMEMQNANDTALQARVSFVMPETFDMQHRPQPNSRSIAFETTKPVYTASFKVGGYPSFSDMNTLRDRLFTALKELGWKHEPAAEYLYYDAPTQFFNRRNEVLVRLVGFAE
jgi:SOUL heme-binding protein